MRDDERARRELLVRLEEVLGPDQAATLMENLPPRRWSELTTKDDLVPLRADVENLCIEMRASSAHLEEVLDLRFAAQGDRFEAIVRERLDSQTKLMVFTFVGVLLATAGIAVGAVAL